MSVDRPASFWQWARMRPDAVAVVDHLEQEHRAGELLARIDGLATRLQQQGFREGDTVAVAAAHHIDALCVALAAYQIGGYYVPVSNRVTEAELSYIIDNSNAAVVFAEASSAPAALAAARSLEPGDRPVVVLGGGVAVAGAVALDEFVGDALGQVPQPRRSGQLMPYTSGTTGRPKGVRRPLPSEDPDEYWAMASQASMELLRLAPRRPQQGPGVHLVVSPLSHTAIITLAVTALHAGQLVVIRERFEALDTLKAMERYRVTNAHMVPTHFHRLLSVDADVRRNIDLTSVQTLLHGAAPCPMSVKRKMIDWLGEVICEYYGASEGGGTFVTSAQWLARPGTVGLPYPHAEIHILDDEGQPVGPGEVGRVFIRSGGDLFEYHGDPDKTLASRQGDLITAGDLGYLDDAGYLFLCGRANDLIITGGVNVYPAEVEDALFAHPGVADSAVIGIGDEEWGEIVTAIVELAPDWSPDDTTRTSLLEHCAQRLTRYKIPKRIEFVAALPREPNGKVRKPQLKAQYQPSGDA